MASKIKLKVSEFEGRHFYLERFAYDVFTHSAVTFGVPKTCMHKWKGAENTSTPPDFINVLSRIIFKYQITQRMNWCCLFYVRYFITKFKSFEDIQDALQIVLKLSVADANGCLFMEVILSLAVFSELIRYLYDNSCNMYMVALAFFWTERFCRIRKEFEEAGGFTEMYKRLNRPKYDSLDLFYNEFIPKCCGQYDFYPRLQHIFYVCSKKYFERIAKNLSVEEKREYYAVFSATVFRRTRYVMEVTEILRLGLPPKIETFATYVHEWITVARKSSECAKILPDGVTSSQNLFSTSCQEMASETRVLSTQVEGPRAKSSSRSTGEDFGQLNLGSSTTEPGNLRTIDNGIRNGHNGLLQTYSIQRFQCVETDMRNKAFRNHLLYSWYGEYIVTAFRNPYSTTCLIETRECRVSSSRKRKSSSISSEEGTEQLNLGSSETEQSSDPGNTELEIGLAEQTQEAISAKYEFFMDYLFRFDLHNQAKNPNDCAKFDEKLRKSGLLVADAATPSR